MLNGTKLKPRYTLKEKIFAHIEIWRPYTVIWCGLVSLAASCIAYDNFPPLKIAILVTIIPMLGWISGLYLIDIIDRKLDIIQKPHRPIPSGRIKKTEALIVGCVLVTIGLLLTIYLNYKNILFILIVAVLVFSYAKFTKSRGLLGNINRGLVTVVAYLFGVFSVDLSYYDIPLYIWSLSLIFLIHDVNSNMIGAIRDIEGDKKGGYVTLPVKFGVKNVGYISFFMSVILYLILLYIVFTYDFLANEFFILLFIDIFILASFYVYFVKSLKKFSRKKALNYHKFLVIERIVLASAFIFGVANSSIALFIFILTLIITGMSQYILRDRYEFKEIK
jgi:4-hydroxybenzoate polyprenyltransferase/geranylgeranylglycerol-phosphate geranylgeranyltransferase